MRSHHQDATGACHPLPAIGVFGSRTGPREDVESIYGGTNEIMQSIIARDLTGLRT